MVDFNELEQYFDHLMAGNGRDNHALSDDSKRFEYYDKIAKALQNIAAKLQSLPPLIKEQYSDYIPIIDQLTKSINALASIGHEDMDYYLRTLAVEKLVYKASGLSGNVPEHLHYLTEALSFLFFEEESDILKTLQMLMKELQGNKTSWFKKNHDEEIKSKVDEVLNLYEKIETALAYAKEGVIVKDKKMMEVLKSLKMQLGECVIKQAVNKTVTTKPKKAKPPSKRFADRAKQENSNYHQK